jgi:hypothetical protein
MKTQTRKSIHDDLKPYDYFAKENDYIEITEWSNGEGFDVDINARERFSLTHGEFKAVKKLLKEIYK